MESRATHQPQRIGSNEFHSEARAAFIDQVEQELGEGFEPDTDFFVESWTVGVAAAAESFLHRRRRYDREIAVPDFFRNSCIPIFSASEYAELHACARSFRSPRTEEPAPRTPGCKTELPSGNHQAMTVESACRVLGVAASSTREQIKLAYRQLARLYHPDRIASGSSLQRGDATERMAQINEAYRLLSETRSATQ
ncbi:MAG TPA: J domain-containing protein [Terracidiphilus sp.]|nr:J domain-containing protein [Terracidiphilus sp.]